ncbi:McKusick-Kaufman/Bardet-Biedl syndromes putative chaperonin [Engraulis encrasicolus]|uniref:McKusick-Kaufman/Bardet-Biedl syndromes putative chaperonin n=1 Tax=Engraulis encrasicolus TaxID=184585 RepID=UPI002FD448C4
MLNIRKKKTQSVCKEDPLSGEEINAKLTLLWQIVTSCYGPRGRLKHVHNNLGNHIQTTSTSAVLFKTIQTSEPLLKLLVASLQNHTQRYSDCGLFAAILCLGLVEGAKQLINHNAAEVISVYKHIQKLCNAYLMGNECKCKIAIDFSSCQELLVVARSVITSKPACGLNAAETLHISTMVTKAFLQTIPTSSSDSVHLGKTVMVALEGEAVQKSAVLPGVLIDMPDSFPPDTVVEQYAATPCRVAVFNASLSGDLSEVGEAVMEIHHRGSDVEAGILDTLLELGEQMRRDGVKLFMCQRVIHPVLQQYLREHGIVVVERFGIALLDPIISATGAQAMATVGTPFPPEAYGQVDTLRRECFGNRPMLHLLPSGSPAVCTMVLCHRNETVLNELKLTCEKALHVLQLTLKEPYALLGGGCTETHLAAYIRQTIPKTLGISGTVGCSPSDLQLGAEAFCHALEAVVTTLQRNVGLSTIDHMPTDHVPYASSSSSAEETNAGQPESCGCGHFNSRHLEFCSVPPAHSAFNISVLDSFLAKVNALNVAVEMASLLLDIKYIINDVN